MSAAKVSRPPARAALVKSVVAALEDMKALNVKVLDVRKVTDVSDCMVVASGNSDRHVRSIADRVVEYAKAGGFRPLGVEGERDGEWVLVDLNDVLVHVMLPRVREFYALEQLWDIPPAAAKAKARAKPAPKARKAAVRAGLTKKKYARPKAKAGTARAKKPATRSRTAAPPARKSVRSKGSSRPRG
ncbi:MAG: ribosome silencing factor [Steroidobacteraceae bacterium]